MSIELVAQQCVPFSLDLTNEFRGIKVRTGALISGSTGWGEFAPFPEYSDAISARWLAGALEAAFGKFPERVRASVPVNAIIPILGRAEKKTAVESAVTKHGMTTFKLKVGGAAESLADDLERCKIVRTTLDELGVVGKIRIDVNGNWKAIFDYDLKGQGPNGYPTMDGFHYGFKLDWELHGNWGRVVA